MKTNLQFLQKQSIQYFNKHNFLKNLYFNGLSNYLMPVNFKNALSIKYFSASSNHSNNASHEKSHNDHSHDHSSHHGNSTHSEKEINLIDLHLKDPYHRNHYNLNHLAHHGDSHHGHSETGGIKLKFDNVKYTRTLNQEQRKEEKQIVPLVDDDRNEPTAAFNFQPPREQNIMLTTPVMIGYGSRFKESQFNIIDETDIRARIYNLLRQFDFMELDKFDFSKDYEKELGLDSLDWTAILTSIEYEFHTVFNDTFYEHWRTLEEVVQHLKGDEFLF